ncbi:hypothetical protein B0G77_6059 [Paraburkholderia sp. BL10I2N1]|nr:hypothetical protein B0G77_6059 [Paraburkholderia sp. BL10I2N1]
MTPVGSPASNSWQAAVRADSRGSDRVPSQRATSLACALSGARPQGQAVIHRTWCGLARRTSQTAPIANRRRGWRRDASYGSARSRTKSPASAQSHATKTRSATIFGGYGAFQKERPPLRPAIVGLMRKNPPSSSTARDCIGVCFTAALPRTRLPAFLQGMPHHVGSPAPITPCGAFTLHSEIKTRLAIRQSVYLYSSNHAKQPQ